MTYFRLKNDWSSLLLIDIFYFLNDEYMKIVKIEEDYYSDYSLADEFDNDIDRDEGILIYDGRDGNVVQTISWGGVSRFIR